MFEKEANETFEHEKLVQIRILSDQVMSEDGKDIVEKDTLIIHIHGGGFIAMSSGSHQSQTRTWAKLNPKAIVCSIDYRLSPKSRFPDALDDVWQAYYWLVVNCESYFGFTLKNIVLVGDSAGGNLCLSLTNLLIEIGYTLPTGIVVCYPCTKISMQDFWPSLLLAVDDYMISQSFLNTCVMSYVPPGTHNK